MVSTLRLLLIYVSLIAVVLAVGITGTYLIGHYGKGFSVPINSPLEAAYFTIVTISTVGYGDIVPVTNTARLFVMGLIITGIGVFLGTVTFISSEIVNTRVAHLRGSLNPFERRLMRDHIVLVGADSVNMRLAERLKEKNIRFIMLSIDSDIVEQLNTAGYRAFIIDETNEEEMDKFALDKAKSIIIDMRDKSRMVYAILVVRNLAEKSKVVAVAHSKEQEKHIRSMGVGVGILSPAEIASNILVQKIEEL